SLSPSRRPPPPTLFPYTTLFRSALRRRRADDPRGSSPRREPSDGCRATACARPFRRSHSRGQGCPPGQSWPCSPQKTCGLRPKAASPAQFPPPCSATALVKLPSGEVRKFSVDCMATIGQVGNLDHENETYGKAGRTRWRGIRPTVRGVAMNPVDHPHGGGEGQIGRASCRERG